MPPRSASATISIWRHHGLSITISVIFLLLMAGQTLTGRAEYNSEQEEHGQPTVTLAQYIRSGHFLEATAENWESEFLQMGFYVWLTSFLVQKGSSESRKPDEIMPVDRDPKASRHKKDAPWPVRHGGIALSLYQYSLSLTFALLFVVCIVLHAVGGARLFSMEQLAHGKAPVSVVEYLGTSQFWFESLQNWQSEFLALAAMVVLSIFLRHKGSPESKPVDAPHGETGS